MDTLKVGNARITLIRGDITEQETDAIVNAANSSLLGGGGVDGAIHRRGGPSILEECRVLRRTDYRDGLPTGDAAATTAGNLPARHVVHTVGPVWRGGAKGEAELLARSYRRSLEVAAGQDARTVAFPSISTGAYGYPSERAARIALRTVAEYLRAHPHQFDEVRFVLFSEDDLATYSAALESAMREE